MTHDADGENLFRRIRDFGARPIEAEGLIIYCLEEMNLTLGWPAAHVFACLGEDLFSVEKRSFWRMHPQDGLDPGRVRRLEPEWPGEKLSPRSGVPWLAYSAREPVWVPDLRRRPEADPQGLLAGAGLRAALAVPVLASDKVLGVLEWFHVEPRDPDDRVAVLGRMVGREVGRVLAGRRRLRPRAA